MNLSDGTPIARLRAQGLFASLVRMEDPRNFSGFPIPRLDFLTDTAVMQRLRAADDRIRELAVEARACRSVEEWWRLVDLSIEIVGPDRVDGATVPELLSLQAWDVLHDFLYMSMPTTTQQKLIHSLSANDAVRGRRAF